MARRLLYICPRCLGRGQIQVSRCYAQTYAVLCRQGKEMSGSALGRCLGIKATAANNRLVALERMRLATSRRCGRSRLFVALPPPGQQ